ncbi:hypothetical protein HDU92_003563 [Lobulomyces angularis]|nr:hypothetical protein HDU92_003563 [Lobulomyces angularis]
MNQDLGSSTSKAAWTKSSNRRWSRRKLIFSNKDSEKDSPNVDRKDTKAIKSLLAQVLGVNREFYWQSLKDYIMGKMDKVDFDSLAKHYLGENFSMFHLHNKLILAILFNAQKIVPPPNDPPSKDFTINGGSLLPESEILNNPLIGKRKQAETTLSPIELKKRIRLREIMTLPPSERERISKLPSISHQEPSYIPAIQQKDLSQVIPVLELLDPAPKTCVELQDLPNKEMIRSRMRLMATLSGLSDAVSNECVELMSFALEYHLKNILGNCLNKVMLDPLLHNTTTEIDAVIDSTNTCSTTLSTKNSVDSKPPPYILPMIPSVASKNTVSAQSIAKLKQNHLSKNSKRNGLTIENLDFAFRISPHLISKSIPDIQLAETIAYSLEEEEDFFLEDGKLSSIENENSLKETVNKLEHSENGFSELPNYTNQHEHNNNNSEVPLYESNVKVKKKNNQMLKDTSDLIKSAVKEKTAGFATINGLKNSQT